MRSVLAAAAILSLVIVTPATAALAVGAPAVPFSLRGTQGQAIMAVDLAELLKQGPVVIFFFPSAFTDGPECRAFSESAAKFRALGARIVGISRDSIETLVRFSTEECPGEFPLASADQNLVNSYDVNDGAMFNTRTTYVVDSTGKIAFVHDGEDYGAHVESALAFVQGMKK